MVNIVNRQFQELFSGSHVRQESYRFFLASQQVFFIGLVLHVLFIPLFFWLGIKELVFFNIVSAALFILCLTINKRGHHNSALWITFSEVIVHATLAVWLIGWESGFYFYLLAIGPMLFLKPKSFIWQKVIAALIPAILFIAMHQYMVSHPPVYVLSQSIVLSLFYANMIGLIIILAHLAYFYSRGASESELHLQRLVDSMELLATTDSMTQLLNRWAIVKEIDMEISRYERHQHPFVIVMGDVDNFKPINDHFGHDAGDSVLIHIARIMKEHLRKNDRLSRWGGEEFLILLPDSDLRGAFETIDKLRRKIWEHPIEIEDRTLNVSMTFGVCEFASSLDMSECIKRADRALYRGKQAGKNQVAS